MKTPKWLKILIRKCETEEQLWFVLTALRGPDSGDKILKYLTTGRIRSIIGINGTDLSICVNDYSLTGHKIKMRNLLLLDELLHFRIHFYDAIKILENIGYDIGNDREGIF